MAIFSSKKEKRSAISQLKEGQSPEQTGGSQTGSSCSLRFMELGLGQLDLYTEKHASTFFSSTMTLRVAGIRLVRSP